VSPVSKNPEDYINYGREVPELLLQNTTPEHVKKIIKKLQPKLSYDAIGVSTKMIKFIGDEIALPLSHIFNISLREGVFPQKLKMCRVIPIFKAGNELDCDNYRPISLLSSISKILEKIVAQKLISHLLENDLLYVHQYGFLPNRSTEHNLLQILNFITKALDEGNYCIGVFLDLKKAFDVCSHEILLKKLQKMGIRGNTYNWFKNYKNKNKNKNIYLSSNRHATIFLRQRRQCYNNISVVDRHMLARFRYIRIIHHVGRLFAHRGLYDLNACW
jgi:hypothetical protein